MTNGKSDDAQLENERRICKEQGDKACPQATSTNGEFCFQFMAHPVASGTKSESASALQEVITSQPVTSSTLRFPNSTVSASVSGLIVQLPHTSLRQLLPQPMMVVNLMRLHGHYSA